MPRKKIGHYMRQSLKSCRITKFVKIHDIELVLSLLLTNYYPYYNAYNFKYGYKYR